MKKYAVGMLLFLVCGCENNFNPATDSSIRAVSFEIDGSALYDNSLVTEQDSIRTAKGISKPDSLALRISAYCYDDNGTLLRKKEITKRDYEKIVMDIPYLDMEKEYRICFIADFVTNDLHYLCPVEMQQYTTSYLTRTNNSGQMDICKSVYLAEWKGKPEISNGQIKFERFSYNTFCVINNLENTDKIVFYADYYDSAFLDKEILPTRRYTHSKTIYAPKAKVTFPITVLRNEKSLDIIMVIKQYAEIDTLKTSVNTEKTAPFVLSIDGKTFEQKITWYE